MGVLQGVTVLLLRPEVSGSMQLRHTHTALPEPEFRPVERNSVPAVLLRILDTSRLLHFLMSQLKQLRKDGSIDMEGLVTCRAVRPWLEQVGKEGH